MDDQGDIVESMSIHCSEICLPAFRTIMPMINTSMLRIASVYSCCFSCKKNTKNTKLKERIKPLILWNPSLTRIQIPSEITVWCLVAKRIPTIPTQRKNKTFDTLKSLTHQDSDSLGNNSMICRIFCLPGKYERKKENNHQIIVK